MSRQTHDPKTHSPRASETKGQIRLASFVILGAFGTWMLASALGGALGLPVRIAFLIDLACMAALVFALVTLFRAWRASQVNTTQHDA